MVYVSRRLFFCAAHRYYDETLSPGENEKLFGKCANIHGHNYELELTVVGEVDEKTGMVINLSELDEIARGNVIDVLDHKNLCVDVEALRSVIPTTEVITKFIWDRLEGKISGARLFRVRLFEDNTLFVDYYGDSKGE